jgi:hypothetical protein
VTITIGGTDKELESGMPAVVGDSWGVFWPAPGRVEEVTISEAGLSDVGDLSVFGSSDAVIGVGEGGTVVY